MSTNKSRVDAMKINNDTRTGYIKELKPHNPQAITKG